MKSRFFEWNREWPEGYLSVTIRKLPGANPAHTQVYERPCDEVFVKQFCIFPNASGFLADIIPNNLGWFIVSPRCREVLQTIETDTRAFTCPVKEVLSEDCPEEIAEYALVSAPFAVDCLDVESPTLEWFNLARRSVRSFERLDLIASKVPAGVSLFGVQRVLVVHVVSGKLRDALLEAGLTGMTFKECKVL